jgi:hypothetical protein
MRLLVLALLIASSLGVRGASAEGTFSQPLTRADCAASALAWDETANVCGKGSGQPLTRAGCDLAGMTWNESANVCGSASERAEASRAVQSALLISIDKETQKMTVSLNGVQRYEWPVSTGQPGYATPSGTYTARSMNKMWYSRQWDNAPMPHAVFFTRDGHAIHGTTEVKRLGKPASHGCVRLAPKNAATLFDLVADTGLENTQIVLAGLTPGGDGRWASQTSSRSRAGGARAEGPRVEEPPRRRGGGLFRRLFGRR